MSCTALITVDLPTLNTRPMLEYEFLWAKWYSPKARTFAGGKQFLNCVFRLSNLGPKIWSIVSKVFLLTLNCCRRYSCGIVGSL